MSEAQSTASTDVPDAEQEQLKKFALIHWERELHAQTHHDAMAVATSRFAKDIAETGLDDVITTLSTKFQDATEGKAREVADELMGRALVAVKTIDVAGCSNEHLTEHLQKVSALTAASMGMRKASLQLFEKQVATFNRVRSETMLCQLRDFQAKVATVLEARSKAFEQLHREHRAILRESMHEEAERIKVRDARAKWELDRKERELQQRLTAGENAHKLEMRKLEAKAEQGKIDREARASLQRELATEMERFRMDFDVASLAMKDAVATNRRMKFTHQAPKIEWSEPPRVIPGSVAWELL